MRRRSVLFEDSFVAEPEPAGGVLLQNDDYELPVALMPGILYIQTVSAGVMRKDSSRELAHVSEIETVTDAPGVIAAAVLGRVVSWEVRSLSIGTSPWTRVLASRGDVCEDAHIATRLVAIGLHAVDFGSLGIARSIGEVPHSEFMVRIVLELECNKA